MSLKHLIKSIPLAYVLLTYSSVATAEVNPEQWLKLNQAVINEHVLPNYSKLAEQSANLKTSSTQLCQSPNQVTLEQTQTSFIDMLNAWQRIQHIQFGPIELLMRSYTIQFWPDKKNLTSKQLNVLLTEADPATLTPDFLNTASIAVKGLPAIERIIFTDDPLKTLQETPFHCQFLQAISGHLLTQTENTLSEWQTYKQEFEYLSSEEGNYESAQEASIDLMKAQVEPLEIIRDLKILRPLGKIAKPKPRRLENWRSENALQNMQHNIQALHHMYSGVNAYNLSLLMREQGEVGLADKIETQFRSIESGLSKLPSPLSKHLQEASVHKQLLHISEQISQLHNNLEKSMNMLELQLGFNSRDGD